MKIKLKNQNLNLPNCWKQCGVNEEEWDKLKSGESIEVKNTVNAIEHLVDLKEDKLPKVKETVKENK